MKLTDHERRLLGFLDQRGPSHRTDLVHELASSDSKIGRAREGRYRLGGASSGHAEALIMGSWCRRLIRAGYIVSNTSGIGFYLNHSITRNGMEALRSAGRAALAEQEGRGDGE